MTSTHTADFAHAARRLTMAARAQSLEAPGFRCPPRLVGVDRSLRRRGGGAVVAVRVRERPLVAVLADMIEGVVAANRLRSPESDRVRAALWEAVADLARATESTTEGAPGSATEHPAVADATAARVA